jgi:hypothetical protein
MFSSENAPGNPRFRLVENVATAIFGPRYPQEARSQAEKGKFLFRSRTPSRLLIVSK